MMATGLASIDTLHGAFSDLRRALDSDDAQAIGAATKAVKAATDAVRAQGAWKMDAVLTEKLTGLRPLLDAARIRVNLASDDVRQRIATLAESGAPAMTPLYRR